MPNERTSSSVSLCKLLSVLGGRKCGIFGEYLWSCLFPVHAYPVSPLFCLLQLFLSVIQFRLVFCGVLSLFLLKTLNGKCADLVGLNPHYTRELVELALQY